MSTVVGLIPAAGRARRIGPLPGSKELLPIGFHEIVTNGRPIIRPKVVSEYLIESMAVAGASRIYLILNKRKWDILCYYGDGSSFGIQIAYLVVDHLRGMPFTLNQARPWLRDETIIFGMPDTIFTPRTAFVDLLKHHRDSRNDVTLGLFRTDKPQRFGMVDLAKDGSVTSVVDKPRQTNLKYMWGLAVWSNRFTSLIGEFLEQKSLPGREIVIGDIFQCAITSGLRVGSVSYDDGDYVDVGTPEDLRRAVRRFSVETS